MSKKVRGTSNERQIPSMNTLTMLGVRLAQSGDFLREPEKARAILQRDWPNVLGAVLSVAVCGNEEEKSAISSALIWLEEILRRQIDCSDAAGRFIFLSAQKNTEVFSAAALSGTLTDDLKDLLQNEFEVPWMMVNGKPVPGFKDVCEQLKIGNFLRRGKNRFDAKPTRACAIAMSRFRFSNSKLEAFKGLENTSSIVNVTWGDIKQAVVKLLDKKERENIERVLVRRGDTHSKADVKEVWLKRCKKAFKDLCPESNS